MHLFGQVPVDPDAATARRWAVAELADPVYHRGRSLLSRLLDWLRAQFDGMPNVALPPVWAMVLVVALVLLVVGGGLWVTGAVRRTRRVGVGGAVLDRDDRRTADQLRTAADEAAAAGRWPAPVAPPTRPPGRRASG